MRECHDCSREVPDVNHVAGHLRVYCQQCCDKHFEQATTEMAGKKQVVALAEFYTPLLIKPVVRQHDDRIDAIIAARLPAAQNETERIAMAELTESERETVEAFVRLTNPDRTPDASYGDDAERFFAEHPDLYDAHRAVADNPEVQEP